VNVTIDKETCDKTHHYLWRFWRLPEAGQIGTVLFKFWLNITKDEQLRRFENRASDKLRSWKLTDEDWRNREKWDRYEEAVNEMLLRTSTLAAPWTVIEGNDKRYARVKVLKTLVDKLAKELDYKPRQ